MILNMALPGGAGAKAEFAYSGAYTLKQITSGGVTYDLYTLTGSGTLTVKGRAKGVDIWLCGGGANGSAGSSGGAGAYCAQYNAQTLSGSYTFAVGAATGASSVTRNSATIYTANGATGKNGGTGGGAGRRGGAGTGDGQSKYPFADTTLFNCHCAGGGGGYGTNGSGTSSRCDGGSGGTNGGNGNGTGAYISPTLYNEEESSGGSGGNYGGGRGGNASWKDSTGYGGGSATFYGSGGGGGGYGQHYQTTAASGGAGYQGVVYIRVPV